MAGEFLKIRHYLIRGEDIQDISGLCGFASLAVGDMSDLIAGRDQTFRDEETKGELGVMPRSAHGDGDALALQSDFQRLFGGHCVLL